MRIPLMLMLAMALAFLPASCSRKPPASKTPEPVIGQAEAGAMAADANAPPPGQGPMPEPSRQGLKNLCGDPNSYISNNAKRALSCWEAKDYNTAAVAMRKLMNLCRSPAQQDAVLSSLAQLKLEIDAAAAKGNANAKSAAAQLGGSGSP